MSVQVLRRLISATERSPGGLRISLDPKALERACAEQGLSFVRLASAANLSRPTVSLAARGGFVTPRSAFKIADALSRGLRRLDSGSERGDADQPRDDALTS
jgi:predicted transcriptional regulator